MNGLEDKADNAKAREAPFMARDHQAHVRQRCLRPSFVDDVCLHDARFGISPSTCTAHSGATKAHDWMVGVLGPLFRSRTHGPHAARRNGKRRPTARRRGNSELPASWQPGLVLRPQRHASLQKQPTPFLSPPSSPPPGIESSHNHDTPPKRVFKNNYLVHGSTKRNCTANFCVFFFYRPTGRLRRTSMPLECHRNATTLTCSVSSARHSTSR